ncbi:N-acetylglucosamine-6-phosphate deacetylase [Octadecabacter sp. 1_MG-2023]|uniref:N-acetylglucosamine-6-phosphate deacetylase n=1 Tax=unclassified Octadecabacter TaxID=196158 RepID=UPI001C0A4A70|nr:MULTISPECIES: N-acetylglucosamine-6-phosphate deacetylase [unclassified Octadecabacter]MBU2994634.1 N-acetylglucosamine-6-phosphate deacetylase [Octadecabacter sp. B2R22]MDO6734073.1 N-acetylglucosamine-6-phosphate deacetylase [Octadecabacter sp. 1_MG-2023]
MTDTWIAPDQLFDGTALHDGLAVRVQDQIVTEIAPAPRSALTFRGTLTPGFVDLQVNGGGGVMVNSTPTKDGLRSIAAAHRGLGTVAILPTVITDRPDVLDQAANAAIAAFGQNGIIGLHIEGPHISVARRGTHSADFIRDLDDRTMDIIAKLRALGMPVKITLAPEAAQPAQISALAATGAIVSLGHTDASAQTIISAIDAGATCGTHLFNAMSQMTGRAPGAVGALINSECHTGIICDGHHVSNEMLGLAIRARPCPDRMFLVSDAMATVGGPDHFNLYGNTISVKEGKLVNAEGNLAGAHVSQAEGVQRLVRDVGLDLQAALRMAITTPATFIERPDLATIIGRNIADLILLSPSLDFQGPLSAVA